jgi:hypothetical protein
MTLTAPLILMVLAAFCFAIETWRGKSLIALGLTLMALSFAVTLGLHIS